MKHEGSTDGVAGVGRSTLGEVGTWWKAVGARDCCEGRNVEVA